MLCVFSKWSQALLFTQRKTKMYDQTTLAPSLYTLYQKHQDAPLL